ncbi:unnamed protein product [Protopolystoma xenopodis]|uniref:Uncharacterized protein n=1 Tax=Protopolystoma xenopodis TaxID=117903 RepID=A0A448WL33_9PLAT|nr:unnamed protein product [Protopolystoma xenopodis]
MEPFGSDPYTGEPVFSILLHPPADVPAPWCLAKARLVTFGAILSEVHLPAKSSSPGDTTAPVLHDVVLGYNRLIGGYDENPGYLGATIGRVAGRIGGAQFRLPSEAPTADKVIKVTKNHGQDCLHGGK